MTDPSLLSQLLARAHEAIFTAGADGAITTWNPGAEVLYGYRATEVAGRTVDFLALSGATNPFVGLIPPPGSREILSGVVHHRHKDGREVRVAVRVQRLVEDGGLLFCAVDLSELRRVEDALAANRAAVESAREELRQLAGRILAAEEDERRRLARELHDDFGQRLSALEIETGSLYRKLSQGTGTGVVAEAVADVERLARGLGKLSDDTRHLSHRLHPAGLERLGLVAALEAHTTELAERTGFAVRLTARAGDDSPLPATAALCLYRVAQEALANASRHSGARQAHLTLVREAGEIRLAVADDGVGFDREQARKRAGLGLASMEERAHLSGGRLRVASAPGMGTEIEVVLPLTDEAGDGSAAGVAGDPGDAAGEHPGQIGPYRLLEVLGEGATATVYLAEEPPPLERKVALKLHRTPLAGRRETLSFKAERQALARLRHPAIAEIYEARTTEEGDLYIVMEHVAGLPITAYCDRYQLDLAGRLALFMALCEGVQHAHQKGVLHRDLKPDNVLVADRDGKPVPKIIDFGIAKGLDQPLAEGTVRLTEAAGTPVYMSPEALAGGEVDTRSDVYALGVILYELLAGVTPIDSTGNVLATLRRLASADGLPRPSRRLAALEGERGERVAADRGTGPRALARALGDELDWIVMRALAPDPAERYASAGALAEDLARQLRGEPVVARPPSLGYRLRGFARRHRVEVAAASLVLLALVAGLATTAWQARRAAREAATAERVAQFLVELFEAPDPRRARGEAVTVREVLDRGAERLSTDLNDEPEIQARLLRTLGVTYCELGAYDAARPLLEEALALHREIRGDNDLEVAEDLKALGDVRRKSGVGDAETLYLEALHIREKLQGRETPEVAEMLHSLGLLASYQGQFEDGRRLLKRALEIQERTLGPEDLTVAMTLHNLSGVAVLLKRFDEAEALMKRSLEIRKRKLPPEHPYLAGNYLALSYLYQAEERWSEAEGAIERALEIQEKALGSEHPDVAMTLLSLGAVARELGDDARAEEAFRRALGIRQRALVPDHDQIINALLDLANLLRDQERYEEAEPLYAQALEYCQKRQEEGRDEPGQLKTVADAYAELLRRTGRG